MAPHNEEERVKEAIREIAECPGGKRIRRHWANLIVPGGIALVALLLPLFLGVLLNFVDPRGEFLSSLGINSFHLVLFGGLYLIFTMEFFFYQWIIWYMDIWIITPDRIFDTQLRHLFRLDVGHVPLEQVQDTKTEQRGFLANQLSFGDVFVQTAGKASNFWLASVPFPRIISRVILRLRDALMEKTSREEPERKEEEQTTSIYRLLGELLVQTGAINKEQLAQAIQLQSQSPDRRVGEILKELGFVTDEQLALALSRQQRLPYVDLQRYQPDPRALQCITKEVALRYMALPLEYGEEQVTIAVADPKAAAHIPALSSACGKPVTLVVAEEGVLKEMIEKYYG